MAADVLSTDRSEATDDRSVDGLDSLTNRSVIGAMADCGLP